MKDNMQKQRDAAISRVDPGTRATESALQSGLHPPTQRVLMHAVVDHLRPEGPMTYRISHRADCHQLFDAVDGMIRKGMDTVQWLLWIQWFKWMQWL